MLQRIRARALLTVVALIMALAFPAGVAVAQQMPPFPFSPSSGGGGLSVSAASALFCKLTGGAGCAMTGTIRASSAAVATEPAYTFDGDRDTGIFSLAADQMSFVSGGTSRFKLTATNLEGAGLTTFRMPVTSSTLATPTYSTLGDSTTGWHMPGSGEVHFSSSGARKMLLYGAALLMDVPVHTTSTTAAAPAVSFTGDTDTGVWNIAANSIGFAAAGANELTMTTASLAPHASSGLALGGDALPFQRLDVADGTTADPAVQVGDEDAGLYYDDTTNTLYVQSPGLDSTTGSIVIVSDTAGGVNVASGTLGWAMYDAATVQSLVSGGGGSGVDLWDPTDVDIRGPTISLGSTNSPYVLDAIRTPNKTASGSAALFQVPRSVSTTPLANATCSSTNAGALSYRDDTDDAVIGAICVCNASSANVYAWRLLDHTTACPL